jgi:hypothetical protein
MDHSQENGILRLVADSVVDNGQATLDKAPLFSADIFAHSRFRPVTANEASTAGLRTILEQGSHLAVRSDINMLQSLPELGNGSCQHYLRA